MSIEQHAHCEICGRVVKVGDRVCDEACQAKLDEATRYKKRQALIFIIIVFGLMVLFSLLRMGVI